MGRPMQRGQALFAGLKRTRATMISIGDELVWSAVISVGGGVVATGTWMIQRAMQQIDARLGSHGKRLARVEVDYVSKDALRQAVGDIKDTIDNWGTDMKHSVDSAHGRLDTIYSELLKRSGSQL